VSNWDSDGYYDNDAWFQAVTYDQTDYQDVDPSLHRAPPPAAVPAAQPGDHGASEPVGDQYAGYDEFGYLVSLPVPLPEADAWQPGAAPWQQPEARREPETRTWQQPEAQPTPPPQAQATPPPQAQPTPPPQAQPTPPPQAPPWPQPEAEPWQQQTRADEAWPQPEARPQPEAEPWQQQTRADEAWPQPAGEAWSPGMGSDAGPWRPSAPQRPRWLLAGVSVVAAAALGFSVVMLTHRGNQSRPAAAPPAGTASPRGAATPSRAATPSAPAATAQPPITRTQAQQLMAAYTTANNSANAQASQTLLATVEGGGSLAIDSGIYDAQRASHAAGFPAYGPVSASYYIPLESPAAYPHWFAVRVTNAQTASGKVFNTEYVVFTQAAAGARWLDTVEPFIFPSATLPSVALNASGYATAVPSSATGLALSPGAASAATATTLDSGTGQPANPGNLADEENLASFSKSLPSHTSVTSRHSASTSPTFALRTTDGGALLFYDVGARLTLAAPPGGTLHVTIPGFVSSGSQASQVTLDYLDQFAVVDPPTAGAMPARVIADYSGLVGSAG